MKKYANTKKLAMMGFLTALVILLQAFVQIRFGVFAISTVLVPIVIGGALYGCAAGAWLGFVFGATVLLSGDATFFLGLNAPGTIILVIVKGVLCGLGSAYIYKLISEKNKNLASIAAGIACPVINTGLFIIGCLIFFNYDMKYVLTAFVGLNFFIEVAVNVILNPIILRLIHIAKSR